MSSPNIHKEKLILLQNINTQLEHLLLRFDKLSESVNELHNKVDTLDKRIPVRRQGLLGGYWEILEDNDEDEN